ncbi:PGPGW domain-containing protein [Thalassotalea piscium]
MDTKYFLRKVVVRQSNKLTTLSDNKESRHITFVISVVKVIVGICFLVCGFAMLFLPGQGLITMLIGLSLLPFPGKAKFERRLLARKSIRSTLNWIRKKANKDPFIFD